MFAKSRMRSHSSYYGKTVRIMTGRQGSTMGISAYQRARSVSEPPRTTEHRLLGQVTGALLEAERAGRKGAALMDVLHWNREVWATFGATCADAANRLPPPLRGSIISLSLWVDRHSSEVIAGRGELADLIEVNRLVMDGLAQL